MADKTSTAAFINRWQGVSASELATAQSFVIELCELLGVEKPHPTDDQAYMFERPVTFSHGDGSTSAGRIDCYKRGHFVLEAKKVKAGAHTKGFDDALLRARAQGEGYARALPAAEGRPPFVLVVDVGHVIEVYAEFSRSGGTYTPYPDPRSHRIQLQQLAEPGILERLRAIWADPLSLDPSRISAKVTRRVAPELADLAKSLEAAGHPPEQVAGFLTRVLDPACAHRQRPSFIERHCSSCRRSWAASASMLSWGSWRKQSASDCGSSGSTCAGGSSLRGAPSPFQAKRLRNVGGSGRQSSL